jgi:hypothetical protein
MDRINRQSSSSGKSHQRLTVTWSAFFLKEDRLPGKETASKTLVMKFGGTSVGSAEAIRAEYGKQPKT